jgi:hypothetical protein
MLIIKDERLETEVRRVLEALASDQYVLKCSFGGSGPHLMYRICDGARIYISDDAIEFMLAEELIERTSEQ